jgi:hypothetical protein
MTGTKDAHSVPRRAPDTGTPAAGPATPGPATPGPATPGPATPGPATPGPATPGPATPGPATSGAGGADDDAADEALLASLRWAVAEADPVPDRVFEAARLAINFRDGDAELARLVADSTAESADTAPAGDASHRHAQDEPMAGAVRSGGPSEHGPLMLSFASGGVNIDLEVTRRGRMVDVVGQLVGATETGCTIEDADGPRDVELDALGQFIVEGLRSGPIRLRCRSADGVPVTTAWISV